MSARRLADLGRPQRRRAVAATALRCALATAAILVLYYFLPLTGGRPDAAALLRLVIGAVLFTAVMTYELRALLRAELPQLRAMEVLAVALALFLALFAGAYVCLADLDPGSFSAPVDRTAGLYFAIVTLGTVGYGDITPVTDFARVLVSVQVLIDLAFLALLLRLVVDLTRRTLHRDADR
ncbi:Ion channel [Actinacidiphila alni]|uniref:Ion channel n=1 Tax=Actinacidiphila alni TaxID=380248 RepID=A0A1I2KRD2_9ACTN|nr:potassium channel family protein [Actinacidiphila alni]SFF68869.1 Ion channel [Actinacidiphila alni]